MLSFFRRLRMALISNTKVSTYLLYAMGEIALVVIGILVALQINNWNEARISSAKEQRLLIDLKSELEFNLDYLQTRFEWVRDYSIANGIKLINSIGPRPKPMEYERFTELLRAVTATPPMNIQTGVVENIMSAESFEVLQNDSMKYLLTEYKLLQELLISDAQGRADDVGNLRSYGTDHLLLRNSYRRITWLDDVNQLTPSSFGVDLKVILTDPRFENVLIRVLAGQNYVKRSTQALIDHISRIIGFMDRNYDLKNSSED